MSSAQPNRTSNPPAWRLPVLWVGTVVIAFLLGLLVRPMIPMAQTDATPAAQQTAQAQPTAPGQQTAGAQQTAPPQQTLSPEEQQAQREAQETFLRSLPRRQADDALALGKVDAKVVLTNWSDYRCPYCSMWHQQTMPQLMKYVEDGTLRIEFRDLAIFGEQSVNTAIAARAAGKQGKFWEYQDAVFAAATPGGGHPDITHDKLLQFAKDAKVPDLAAFEASLTDSALSAAVQADSEEARQFGIAGTPFFVVGLTPVNGAQPADRFIQVIEQEAAR